MLGSGELVVILLLILLLFGGKKVPELARSLGLGLREFKRACQGDEEDPSQSSHDALIIEKVKEEKKNDER